MTITMQTDSPADYVQGLRDVANFLESHPSLIPPYSGVDIYLSVSSDELRPAMRNLGGQLTKKTYGEDLFEVARHFGPHKISLNVPREEVCERKVTVEVEEVEEVDPEALAALPKVKVTREVEHVEWICPPSLLADEVLA